jgi:hypothetical protein
MFLDYSVYYQHAVLFPYLIDSAVDILKIRTEMTIFYQNISTLMSKTYNKISLISLNHQSKNQLLFIH